ncbi:MAG: putative porin, partial [Pyrinomonadaceae bacterium]
MKSKSTVTWILTLIIALLLNTIEGEARQQVSDNNKNAVISDTTTNTDANKTQEASGPSDPVGIVTGKPSAPSVQSVEDRLKALEQVVEQQRREIQSLREIVGQRGEKSSAETASVKEISLPVQAETTQPSVAVAQMPVSNRNEPVQPDQTQKRVDELYKKFGAIRFSGDLRFRTETFRNQGFDNSVEAPARNRLRVRARLALDGTIDNHFDWGVRVATGTFTDPITSNQTFTDFFERKAFSLDRAFIRYDSKTDKVGVQLIAGKFEPTFRRTQMIWDDDLNVEGVSEALYFKTNSSLKQIKLVAFQLPFNELPGGKDGILYGGQLQTDWQASRFSGNVNVGYYDWVGADQVVLALGAASTQVGGGIVNTASVSGEQNGPLGTTNRIVRNAAGQPTGFLAGFNLFDVLGNLTWAASRRFPITFTVDYVHNLTNRVEDEKNGYWVGASVGQTKEKGDWLFGYYFTRIEQDSVLVPFNFGDILGSNSRAHMPVAAYQLVNNVTLQWTGLFSQRANKIVPLSPVNRYLNRMQFDVIYK